MKPSDILLGETYTNGRQERQVLSWSSNYGSPSVLYRVVGKRGGGPLRLGDTSIMTVRQFAAWASSRVEGAPT